MLDNGLWSETNVTAGLLIFGALILAVGPVLNTGRTFGGWKDGDCRGWPE